MAGISTKAVNKLERNKYGYNGNELQNEEFGDGSGLELYDFNARTYDQQIGRFMQIDPLTEQWQEHLSPYHFGFNNPIRYNDPDGKYPGLGVGIIFPIAAAIEEAIVAGGAAAGIVLVADKLVKIIRELPPGTGTANPTTVPLLPLPGEVMGKTTLKSEKAQSNEQPTDLPGNTALNDALKGQGSGDTGTRRKNRLPDVAEPNSTQTNAPGTTAKKYGPDGKVQKEYNKGHQGDGVPKNEKKDHVHDYKPDSRNPSGHGKRQPGRPLKKNELKKDFGL